MRHTALHSHKSEIFATAICLIMVLALAGCGGTNAEQSARPESDAAGSPGAMAPMLNIGGKFFTAPHMAESFLPDGFSSAGTLTAEQAYNTGHEGVEFFTDPDEPGVIYTFSNYASQVAFGLTDSGKLKMQYMRWESTDIESIFTRYPEYMGLPTDNGLYIYVWQMTEGTYQCGLSSSESITDEELSSMRGITPAEMKSLLASYGYNIVEPQFQINVVPVHHPLSACDPAVTDEYISSLQEMFFGDGSWK